MLSSIKWEDREDSFANAETVGGPDKRNFSTEVDIETTLEWGEELIDSNEEHWHCVQIYEKDTENLDNTCKRMWDQQMRVNLFFLNMGHVGLFTGMVQ